MEIYLTLRHKQVCTKKLLDAFEGVDTVFHLAAKARVQPSIKEPVHFNATNVEGTLNMLEYSRKAKVRRFVFTSSSSIYGNTEIIPTLEDTPPNPIKPLWFTKVNWRTVLPIIL